MVEFDEAGRISQAGNMLEQAQPPKTDITSLSLNASDQPFRMLLEHSPNAAFIISANGTLMDANRMAETVTGYGKHELVGKNIFLIGILDHEDLPRVTEMLQEIGLGNPTGPVEFNLYHKDKSIAVTEISGIPIRLAGRPAAIGIIRDITDQRKTETALRESEEKYRVVVENAGEAILILQDDKLKFFNPVARELCQLKKFGESVESIVRFVHPDDREMVVNIYKDRLRGKEAPGVYEFRIIDLDGNLRWIEVHAKLVKWDGKPATLIFFLEITDRKKGVEAIEKSEERFRSLAEISSDFIWETNKDGECTFASPKLKELFGYECEEIAGKTILDFACPLDTENAALFFKENRTLKRKFRGREITTRRKDGCRVVCEVSGIPLFDANGEFAGYRGIARDITDRKLTEEYLRESERRLRSRLEYLISPGSNLPEFTLQDLVSLEELQKIQDSFSEVTGTATIITSTDSTMITKPSNFNRVCEIVYSTEEGRRRCDESDRMRTENARQSREPVIQQCLSCGFTDASVPIIVAGRHIANWLVGQCNTMHISRESIAKYAREIGADPDELLTAYDRTPRMSHAEFRRTLNLLSLIVGEISAIGFSNLKLARDFTELKRVDMALRKSEEQYRSLVETMNEGLALVDKDHRLTYVNERLCRILGYAREELIGKVVTDFVDEEYKDALFEEIIRRKQGDTSSYEIGWRAKDGRQILTLVSPRGFFNENGEFLGSLGVLTDITEYKQLEEQLRQAAKMEAIGRLAGGIAHDFNNLLTGILGYSNLLKMNSSPGDSVHDAARTIEKAAERATELTQQLLGFARRGKHQIIPVDIHNTIKEVASLLDRTIGRNIRIKLKLQAGDRFIKGDPVQMQQVLLNLGINARDAMPRGGELTFETRVTKLSSEDNISDYDVAPGRCIVITVRDTGIGITKEIQERIFEPFFTTKKQGEGTGMGLAMVYGIIRNHGGSVKVDSQPEHGAAFRIYLPLVEEEETNYSIDTVNKLVKGTGRILLVDDEEVIRIVASDLLTNLGYEVVTASNGKEAVEIFNENWPEIDMVIIDMMMPVMDGPNCFREMKRINPDVKAFLSTGYGVDGQAQQLLDEGMIGFIQKPYNMAALSTKLREAMANV